MEDLISLSMKRQRRKYILYGIALLAILAVLFIIPGFDFGFALPLGSGLHIETTISESEVSPGNVIQMNVKVQNNLEHDLMDVNVSAFPKNQDALHVSPPATFTKLIEKGGYRIFPFTVNISEDILLGRYVVDLEVRTRNETFHSNAAVDII